MCVCVLSFGYVQWRFGNCLLTPSQYVRIISHTALFRGGEGETRVGEEGEGT